MNVPPGIESPSSGPAGADAPPIHLAANSPDDGNEDAAAESVHHPEHPTPEERGDLLGNVTSLKSFLHYNDITP